MTEVTLELERARVMLDLKRYDQATSLLARIVAEEPAHGRAWCMLAAAHLSNSQYQESLAAAGRSIVLAPSDDWPYRLVSIAQVHLGDTAAAIDAANEACRLAPNTWRAHLCLAQAELATKASYAAAERAAADARRLGPNEPDVYFISGKISLARGELRGAREYQERTLALDPAHSGAQNELGRISLHRVGMTQAARHFIQAARSAPRVTIYSRNVEIVVGRVVNLMIYVACLACLALVYATTVTHLSRSTVVLGLAGITALGTGLGALQIWRMPPETRPLFRTRRVIQALGLVYASFVIAMIAAAVAPTAALPATLIATVAITTVSRFAASMILRPTASRNRS
jgi:tetratricopeptide (TPR) repeat protein